MFKASAIILVALYAIAKANPVPPEASFDNQIQSDKPHTNEALFLPGFPSPKLPKVIPLPIPIPVSPEGVPKGPILPQFLKGFLSELAKMQQLEKEAEFGNVPRTPLVQPVHF
ncbi:hypothetical protein HHI36_020461 [Cryptolaemus montrouzieri]|uniref:Uncharacterized protein n=1 Tax=Cryptolaemus montrouzieri TaxID=559131 RepID=A0ABD2NAZ4_9CUCU